MNEKLVYYLIAILLLLLSVYAIYSTLSIDPFYDLISERETVATQNVKPVKPTAVIQQDLPKMKVGDTEVLVEISDNDIERAQGLSGREKLIPNTGMLFVWDQLTMPAFWMYDMNFDLDMIWIRDGKVVDITQNVPAPAPDTPKSALPRYYPSQKIDSILEVNSDFIEKNNIQIGDPALLLEE